MGHCMLSLLLWLSSFLSSWDPAVARTWFSPGSVAAWQAVPGSAAHGFRSWGEFGQPSPAEQVQRHRSLVAGLRECPLLLQGVVVDEQPGVGVANGIAKAEPRHNDLIVRIKELAKVLEPALAGILKAPAAASPVADDCFDWTAPPVDFRSQPGNLMIVQLPAVQKAKVPVVSAGYRVPFKNRSRPEWSLAFWSNRLSTLGQNLRGSWAWLLQQRDTLSGWLETRQPVSWVSELKVAIRKLEWVRNWFAERVRRENEANYWNYYRDCDRWGVVFSSAIPEPMPMVRKAGVTTRLKQAGEWIGEALEGVLAESRGWLGKPALPVGE